MDIKLELLKGAIYDVIDQNLENIDLDIEKIPDTKATNALFEIQKILKSDKDDFELVEEIVCVFEKYNIDCLPRHDF